MFFSNILAGIAGFGCNIMALPFLTLFVSLKVITPTLLLTSIFNNTIRSAIYFKHIEIKQFFKIISITIIGALAGGSLLQIIPENYAKIALAIFMIIISLKNISTRKKKTGEINTFKKMLLLFLSGSFQGAFASGGPFLAVYCVASFDEKEKIRGYQYSCSCVISIISAIQNAFYGNYNQENLILALWFLPAAIFALVISEKIVKKVNNALFKKIVYVALLVMGIIMIGMSSKGILF